MAMVEPLLKGFGEGYSLDWYGTQPPTLAGVEAAWTTLLANQTLAKWKQLLGWNNVRLGFFFKDLTGWNNAAASYQLDSTNADGTLTILDKVIELLYNAGYQVTLCYMAENGPPALSDANALTQDWKNIAQHYAGDTRISMYQVANEMQDNSTIESNFGGSWTYEGVTYTGGYMPYIWQIVQAIRAFEPKRSVVCPTPAGQKDIHNFNLAVHHTRNRRDLLADWHTSTYSGTGCMEASQIWNWPRNFWADFWAYHVPIVNGEINAQQVSCNNYSIAWLDQMITGNIDYVCWGYKEYPAWDTILSQVVPS